MAELKKLGRYELRRVLGKGAMGVVYEGFDPTLSRRVAVKTILKSVAHDEETERNYAERFVREAKAVARLNHPNIVQVFDFGVADEVAYLVMEFIEGRELSDAFSAGVRFESTECIRVMGELLDALDFAHEAGVIHRDVKPANVMLDAQRRVKLADFGVARVSDSERSAAGTMVGTPAFMSPEQISGGKVDRRTDIFSAGTILYQLLTGKQPFKGEGAWTVAKQIMQDDPPSPSSVVKSVSPAFDAIVEKALAKNPAQRFASAKEFAAALRDVLQASRAQPGGAVASAGARKPRVAPQATDTELEFWRSIQNRDDLDELELFLEQFPEGAYAHLARLKVAKLRVPLEAARAAQEKGRQEAEERKARQEAEARERREAEEVARRVAEEKARRAAVEQAKADAEERARREAAAKAKREADERARQEAEEKIRKAQALARLQQQEEAAARAKKKATVDEDSTVALPPRRSEPAPVAAAPAAKSRSMAIPAALAAVVVVGGVAAYLFTGRTPAPVAETAPLKPAAVPAPAPVVDADRIRRETEEKLRKEYAEKAAAERAALEKSLAERIAAEAAAAQKVVQAKSAAEKAAAEKAAAAAAAARAAAEKDAVEKAAAQRANEERAAGERVAAERAAAEKVAADKAAAERDAATKLAAEKAAAEKQAAGAGSENLLERFIQRVGRDKVVKQEPPPGTFNAYAIPALRYGEVVYVNDGSCGPGKIREVTGVTSNAQRPSRCIALE